jgi:predicted RNase H-like HicB family nuclease
MKKDFIPYEQALALKELGFDEPCYGWFDTGHLRFGCYESEYVTGLGDLPAPLYQQAFRWFREKHGLRHFIEYDYGYYIALIQPPLVYSHGDTYEEAELACLKKLIELSTETNNPQTKP